MPFVLSMLMAVVNHLRMLVVSMSIVKLHRRAAFEIPVPRCAVIILVHFTVVFVFLGSSLFLLLIFLQFLFHFCFPILQLSLLVFELFQNVRSVLIMLLLILGVLALYISLDLLNCIGILCDQIGLIF